MTIDLNEEIPIVVQDAEATAHNDEMPIECDNERMDIDRNLVADEIAEKEDDHFESVSTCHSLIYVERPLITVVPEKTEYVPELSKLARSTLANVDSLKLPTYSGYNSELMRSNQSSMDVANIMMFPLIPGPASSYSAIYTSLMLAQNITTHVAYGSKKTIIALDLDLYERALQLRNSRDDLRDKFILRLGELHIVFAHIRAIGRFIENTGLDDAWIRSEVVGPNTVKQVLTCTHMKRALSFVFV